MSQIRTIAAIAGCIAAAVPAFAQNWPARPVTMVVPSAPGGGADAWGRVMAPHLTELLGRPVIVENVGGAGGMTGSARVAKAPPDGYQFVVGNAGTHAIAQGLSKHPLYDARTDFAPVILVADQPLVLIARKDLPANNVHEFAAYAKQHQADMHFTSSGVGSGSHLGCLLFNSAIGVQVTHVPYRSVAPAIQDLIAGRIDYACSIAGAVTPQIEGNLVKPIALLTRDRPPSMPNIPTAHEQGLTDFGAAGWLGFFMPKGTPPTIVKKVHDATVATIDMPAVQKRLTELGGDIVEPARRSPEYLQKLVEEEVTKWATVIKDNGVTAE